MIQFRTPRLAVGSMFFLNGAFTGAWAVRVPFIKERFGLTPDDLSWLLLLMAVGALCAFPFSGKFSDKFGAAPVTLIVGLLFAVLLVALGSIDQIWLFAAVIFLFGAGYGGMDVAMNSWGAQVETSLGRPIMSSLHGIWSVGSGFGALCGIGAIELGITTAAHFLFFAILTTLVTFYFALLPWTSPPAEIEGKRKVMIFPRGPLLILGLIALCSAISEGAVLEWSALFVRASQNTTEAAAGLAFMVFSVAMAAMRLTGDRWIARFGEVRMIQASGILAASGFGISIFAANLVISLFGFFLTGLGLALIMPLVFSRAAASNPKQSGEVIASVAMLGYGGFLLGPPLMGHIADWHSYSLAFAILAALSFAMFILSNFVRKSPEK